MIKKLVLSPLLTLKSGLDSFFSFLQEKNSKIETININSNDEFQTMSKSINKSINITSHLHKEIHLLNTNLEQKVKDRTERLEERSSKIRELLDIAAEGFLSFNSSLQIDSEYSKECENIFEKSISNLNIAQLLYSKDSDNKKVFIKIMNDIFNPKIVERKKKVLLNLLEKDFFIEGKYIKVEYNYIKDQKIILILTDVTDKKALEQRLNQEKQILKMIVSCIKDVDEFKFYGEDNINSFIIKFLKENPDMFININNNNETSKLNTPRNWLFISMFFNSFLENPENSFYNNISLFRAFSKNMLNEETLEKLISFLQKHLQ